MRITRLVASAALLAASLAAPGVVLAQGDTRWATVRPGVSLGGRGAFFDPEDGDGNWHGGAQIRMHLSRFFALEGSADYRREDFPGTEVNIFPVQASLLAYLFPDSPISPFLLGGVGWYFLNVEGPGGLDDTDNTFGPHVGGGLQFFLNRYWSIDGTYRYVWVEDVNTRDPVTALDREFNSRGHMATIGINFHF